MTRFTRFALLSLTLLSLTLTTATVAPQADAEAAKAPQIPACGAALDSRDGTFPFAGTTFPSVEDFRRRMAEPFVRCATPPPTTAIARQVDADLRPRLEWIARRGDSEEAADATSIPVAFHVIHDGNDGQLTEAQIAAQISHLNSEFSGSGFSFQLSTTTYTDNASWFQMGHGSSEEREAKEHLNVDPYRTLNLYTVDGSGTLGWATFPWSLPSDPDMDGVVVLHTTLPGGAAPYDEGDTAVHEVGHWLGLWHTFRPIDACTGSGDFVDDTHAEKQPTTGCPASVDSCPNEPGDDNLDNFMNYVDDCCMDTFTAGQRERMEAATAIYRPLL